MSKKALVISGGGSKGAFAVGVIKSLAKQIPLSQFDIFVGTSTGSLIAPMAAIGKIDFLEEMYTTIHTNDIVTGGNIVARLTNSVSIFDATPLAALIKKFYNNGEARKILDLNKQLFITTTCLQTSESVIFSNKGPLANSDYHIEKLKNETELRRAIFASTNQPVFMQPVEVSTAGGPVRQYVDGGVREYLGIQVAVDAGAEEIIAISLAAHGNNIVEKTFVNAVDILFKTIDIFTTDVGANDFKLPEVYNSALKYIEAVKDKMKNQGIPQSKIDDLFTVPSHELFVGKKPIRIHHIFPSEPLGGGTGGFEFNPAEMKGMVAKGQNRVEQYIAGLSKNDSLFA